MHCNREPRFDRPKLQTTERQPFPHRPGLIIVTTSPTSPAAVMFGVACMQTLSGIIVGAFEPLADGARSETAYRALFAVLSAVLIVAVAIYSRSQDIKPSDEMRTSRQREDA